MSSVALRRAIDLIYESLADRLPVELTYIEISPPEEA